MRAWYLRSPNNTRLHELNNEEKVRHSTLRTLKFPCWNGTIGILNIVTLRNGTHRAFFLSAAWLAVNGNIFVGTRVWVIMYLLRASTKPRHLGGADTTQSLHRVNPRSVSGENWK